MTAPPAVSTPPAAPAAGRGRRRTPRTLELGLLLLAMLVVAGFAAAVELQLLDTLSPTFWVQPAVLTALFLAGHVTLRLCAPYADPVLLPAAALLTGVGVAFLRRLDLAVSDPNQVAADSPAFSGQGGQQLIWTAVAVAGLVALLVFVRDHRKISHYAWTIGLVLLAR